MADWRLMLCDRYGAELEDITNITYSKQAMFRQNRATRFSFTIPVADQFDKTAFITTTDHSDGFPLLEPGVRTIKGFRNERQADGTFARVIRLNVLVWTVLAVGDEDKAEIAVECFDPLVRLRKRHARDVAPNYDAKRVPFVDTDGVTIAKALIDRTNTYKGNCGITTAGSLTPTTPTRTITYQRRHVESVLMELATAFNGFDFALVPLDRDDGTMARIDFYTKKAAPRPDAVMSWGAVPSTLKRVEWKKDIEPLANEITGIGATNTGGGQIESSAANAASSSFYGVYEDVEVFSDIGEQLFLDALTQDALNFRAARQELISIIPQGGKSPEPFTEYEVGDYLPVYAGPRLKGGFQGVSRNYGFDLQIDNEGKEIVNAVYTAPAG